MGVNRLMPMLCYLAFKRHGIDDNLDEDGRLRFEIHTFHDCFVSLCFDSMYHISGFDKRWCGEVRRRIVRRLSHDCFHVDICMCSTRLRLSAT